MTTARTRSPKRSRKTRADGTIREVWRGAYIGPDGEEYTKSGFATRDDAKTWAEDQVSNARRGEWIDPATATMTFRSWAARWLNAKRRIKDRTANDYRKIIEGRKEHCLNRSFGHMPLADIQRIDVEGWVGLMEDLDLSGNSIRNYYRVLFPILDAAVDNDLIPKNPARNVELPPIVQATRRFYTVDQVNDFAWSFPDRWIVLPYVLAWGGLRWGEAAALRRHDCQIRRLHVRESLADIDGRIVFGTTKTHQDRWVSLPGSVADLLAEHLERHVDPDPDALVFTAPNGGPMRLANFRRNVWGPAREAAGLPHVTPHELRHTCASLMRRELGADAHQVKQQLGHARTSTTTDIYQHLFEGELDGLMERADGLVRRGSPRKVGQEFGQERVSRIGR